MDAEVYTNQDVASYISQTFLPVRIHVKNQATEFERLSERYGAQWTPTILELDGEGEERHRIEGFLPADDFLAQLKLGRGRAAFQREEWEEAERLLREVVTSHPDTEAAAEALYWSGVARYKGTKDPKALEATAEAFEKRYPDSSWAKKASVWA